MKISGNLNNINITIQDKDTCDVTLKEFIIEGVVTVIDWYGAKGIIEIPVLGIGIEDLVEDDKINLDKLMKKIYDTAHTDDGFGVQEIVSANVIVYQVLEIKLHKLDISDIVHLHLFEADIDYRKNEIAIKE